MSYRSGDLAIRQTGVRPSFNIFVSCRRRLRSQTGPACSANYRAREEEPDSASRGPDVAEITESYCVYGEQNEQVNPNSALRADAKHQSGRYSYSHELANSLCIRCLGTNGTDKRAAYPNTMP